MLQLTHHDARRNSDRNSIPNDFHPRWLEALQFDRAMPRYQHVSRELIRLALFLRRDLAPIFEERCLLIVENEVSSFMKEREPKLVIGAVSEAQDHKCLIHIDEPGGATGGAA